MPRAFENTTGAGKLTADAAADRALLQHTERLLASAIGAASARRMLTSALRGTGPTSGGRHPTRPRGSLQPRSVAVTFENMMQGISVVDADLCIVTWNRRYATCSTIELRYVGRPVPT